MNNAHEYPKPVRVLIVDDVPNELEQALAELAGSEFAFTFRAAHTLEDLCCDLDWQPDLILCADLLQRFDVYQALEALTLRGVDIPLVVLATELTDDKGQNTDQEGAADVAERRK
jgi:CheY-like chemotaxis protein